jgi:hypothetical protein
MKILDLLSAHPFWVRGSQAAIASELGVSEATISRDIAILFEDGASCPHCGRLQGVGGVWPGPIRTGRRAHPSESAKSAADIRD